MRTMELWAAETTGHWYIEQAGTLASEYAISALTSLGLMLLYSLDIVIAFSGGGAGAGQWVR